MEKTVPELRNGHPIWWHHHGSKIRFFGLAKECLIINANAASLTIQKASLVLPDKETLKNDWFVDWSIFQCKPLQELTSGRRWFTTEDLRNAFGIANGSGKYGKWLIDRYGADAAEQMKYIRWGNYLNIPCPGTGNDGDPNISIEIDDEIKSAVTRLISQH
jgi:hypothetical protein